MATRFIEKGDVTNGVQTLIMHIQDADGRWREEVVGRFPESEIDDRVTALLRSGQVHGTWPPYRPKP